MDIAALKTALAANTILTAGNFPPQSTIVDGATIKITLNGRIWEYPLTDAQLSAPVGGETGLAAAINQTIYNQVKFGHS
jgi:hypothetical protein